MNAFALMLGVTACYTISSLSDKYAAAKAKFTPDGFTFLMILVTLFIICLIRRETYSKANILGGALAIAGVIGFQLCS